MGYAARLRDVCSRVQPNSHRGRYSIQRMCELRGYCKSNPPWRGLVVLVLFYSLRKLVRSMPDVECLVQQEESGSTDLFEFCAASRRDPKQLDLRALQVDALSLAAPGAETSWILQSPNRPAQETLHSGCSASPSGTKVQRSADDAQTHLELLWKCESVLLVEYIETAVPLVYGVSMLILYNVPNAQYYPGVAEMTRKKLPSSITSILTCSALEFVSLM